MRHLSVISKHPIFTGFRELTVVNGTPGIGESHFMSRHDFTRLVFRESVFCRDP